MQYTFDICMFVHNDMSHDARVMKEAASLATAGWRIVVVGMGLTGADMPDEEQVAGFTIWRVTPRLLRRQMPGTWGKLLRLLLSIPAAAHQLRRARARVYHGHDFPALVLFALAGIWRRPIVYDSHELFFDRWPLDSDYPLLRVLPLLRRTEHFLARRTVATITVSEPIATTLADRFGIARPLVVANAVDLRTLQTPITLPRPPGQQVVAHTGYLSTGRHLPELVAALQYLPDDVSLMFIGKGQLQAALETQAIGLGIQDRVVFVPPVPVYAVASTLAQVDCATLMFAPDALNYQYALPNKFFEAVAAGVPLVYGTTQEVNRLAQVYDFGVSCDPTDPRSIADAILRVLEPEANARYRANALRARDTLNWEQEEKKLIRLYETLLNSERNERQ